METGFMRKMHGSPFGSHNAVLWLVGPQNFSKKFNILKCLLTIKISKKFYEFFSPNPDFFCFVFSEFEIVSFI